MTDPTGPWLVRVLREARRRKVYTAGAAYVALALVLIEVGEALFDATGYGDTAAQGILTLLLALGFPVVLVLAWIFDVGPGGVHRTEAAGTAAGPAAPPSGGRPAAAHGTRVAARGPRPPEPPPARATPSEAEPPPLSAPDPERVRRVALAHARHELRTPINAILGYSEMLLEDAEEEEGREEVAADLRRIREGGRELLRLVDTILDPARIEADEAADLDAYGERIRADLRTPATAVIGYAEMLLEGEGAALKADLERILGAARRLLELSGDIVGLATAAEVDGQDLQQAAAMAEGVLAKIRPLDHAPAATAQGSLLVVDDNALNRDLISRQLARMGFMVATAERGAEALERMGEQTFDLVLLDILMPDMDGIEVLRRMKTDEALRDLPVIMISSLDEIDSAIRCLESGAADYLTKPFHPRLLEARIGAVLQVRRLREREAWFRAQAEDGDAHLQRLLQGACPPGLAERLRQGETAIMESYPDAAVAWCNLERAVGGARTPPEERVRRAERVLRAFEAAAQDAGVDTVLLQPPAVILTDGLGDPDRAHLVRVAAAALAAMDALREEDQATQALRVGLHVGEAWAAVFAADRIGVHLWGEAPDLARRLERQGDPGTIHVSPAAQAALRGAFVLASRGVVDVSGRGQMRTFTLGRRMGQPA